MTAAPSPPTCRPDCQGNGLIPIDCGTHSISKPCAWCARRNEEDVMDKPISEPFLQQLRRVNGDRWTVFIWVRRPPGPWL